MLSTPNMADLENILPEPVQDMEIDEVVNAPSGDNVAPKIPAGQHNPDFSTFRESEKNRHTCKNLSKQRSQELSFESVKQTSSKKPRSLPKINTVELTLVATKGENISGSPNVSTRKEDAKAGSSACA